MCQSNTVSVFRNKGFCIERVPGIQWQGEYVGPIVSGYMGGEESLPLVIQFLPKFLYLLSSAGSCDTPVRMWAVAELATFHKIS
jgi:hypothetical protein